MSLILWEKLIVTKYTPKSPKTYKTVRNIDMLDEHKDFWLLETWTRYWRLNHTQQKHVPSGVFLNKIKNKIRIHLAKKVYRNLTIYSTWESSTLEMLPSPLIQNLRTTWDESTSRLNKLFMSISTTATLPPHFWSINWQTMAKKETISNGNKCLIRGLLNGKTLAKLTGLWKWFCSILPACFDHSAKRFSYKKRS